MPHEPLPIFISYANFDNQNNNPEEQWLNRLLQFLKPLELEQKIAIWADTELTIGSNWRLEIKTAIEKAKVAVLLVSPAFLASEFVRSEELPRLLLSADPLNRANTMDPSSELAEGMLILPILLRPCLIDLVRFQITGSDDNGMQVCLADFQYEPRAVAMNGLSQFDQDKILEKVARQIFEAIEIEAPDDIDLTSEVKDDLDQNLILFLNTYSKWWFNSIRIFKWGGSKRKFKSLQNYSPRQIETRLHHLAMEKKIKVKRGNKSRVYKCI